MPGKADQYFSKTLEKGLSILSLFDREHPFRTLTEISRLTGINKTSTFRLVNTLVQMGFLRKSAGDKSLRIGPRAFAMGFECFHGFDVYQGIKPLIDRTFLEHKISVDSALVDRFKLISLYRREMPNLAYFHLPLMMDELYARAMGKVVLADLDEPALAEYLENTDLAKLAPNTLTHPDAVREEIEKTRTRGYSINNQEYVEGIISVGAPMRNLVTRSVVGAVSLDFSSQEYSIETVREKYIGVLLRLAGEASELVTATGI